MSFAMRPFAAAGASLAFLIASVLFGCGATGTITFIADEETTAQSAERMNFKYCNILREGVCQSPDGLLEFRLPLELNLVKADLSVIEELTVANETDELVAVDQYLITLIDDRNIVYQPQFSGPKGYDQTMPFSPALTLMPRTRARITFSAQLRSGSKAVKAVAIDYRLPGEEEFTRVMVSYRPQSLTGATGR